MNNDLIRKRVEILLRNNQGDVLLGQRMDKDSNQPVWTLPGGGIDPGETRQQAVAREALEEVGYGLDNIQRVGVPSMYVPYKNLTDPKHPAKGSRTHFMQGVVTGRDRSLYGDDNDQFTKTKFMHLLHFELK